MEIIFLLLFIRSSSSLSIFKISVIVFYLKSDFLALQSNMNILTNVVLFSFRKTNGKLTPITTALFEVWT